MDNDQKQPQQFTQPNSAQQITAQQYIQQQQATNSQYMQQQNATNSAAILKKTAQKSEPKNNKMIFIVIIIILAVLSAAFMGLFIWKTLDYNTIKNDLDLQINIAVAEAKNEQANMLESEFAEREKNPYKIFAGPVDYGELSFEYPKTWSLYIAADASKGGNFEAYFNPNEVNAVSKTTINALRLTISTSNFESVVAEYQKEVTKKDSKLSVSTITIGDTTGNIYSGTIPKTEFEGYVVIFKIRDKTVIMRTDSLLFKDDFEKLIESVKFNA